VLAHIRVQFERSQVRNQTRPFGSCPPPTDCQVGGLGGRLSARALINRFGGTFFVSFSHFDLPLISPSTLRLWLWGSGVSGVRGLGCIKLANCS